MLTEKFEARSFLTISYRLILIVYISYVIRVRDVLVRNVEQSFKKLAEAKCCLKFSTLILGFLTQKYIFGCPKLGKILFF